jgi:hypothetical protein|tara:strand:+ start:105 stop:434 length:330 start_codon:yes stop_codon:yes gene_type:complete
MTILERFEKYLTNIERPSKKESWNIAGVLKDKNAFYRFDVKDLTKASNNRGFKKGSLKSKAEKMVFEFKDQWIILDIGELNEYVRQSKTKDFELDKIIPKLDWNMFIVK